ncbi:MAG: TrkH family potassium uptake protein, partial [Spirochaetales bacterium]|nr:TrkH family potassium uptake protein [Spirochaetales bacterium]
MRNRFQTIKTVFHSLGLLLIVLGVLLLLPLLLVFAYGETADNFKTLFAFIIPSFISTGLGLILFRFIKTNKPNARQAILICSLGWMSFSAICGIPFVLGIDAVYIDGIFEAASGFTTTGITMFNRLEYLPRSIIFFRSLIQWIGGLGILALFLVIFSGKERGAHRLFSAESHKVDVDRPVPGLASTLKIFWVIYSGFTLFIFICLLFAGSSLFDAVCHSFSALSTGGFSPHDASIGFYELTGHPNYILIEYILTLGMILGGMNFLIHYRILKGDIKALGDNSETRYWWGFIFIFVLIIMAERFLKIQDISGFSFDTASFAVLEENFRTALFQTVSILTSTGFATKDIGASYFGHTARLLFLVMMVIGGCVGSTSGGIKIYRVSVLINLIKRDIFRIRAPKKAVAPLLHDGKPVEMNEVYRICGIFAAWIILLIAGGCVTSMLSDFDALQSFSGMCSALGNIGPCYLSGQEIMHLHPVIKIVYIFGMLAGRL